MKHKKVFPVEVPKRPLKVVVFGTGARARVLWGRLLQAGNQQELFSASGVFLREAPVNFISEIDNVYTVDKQTDRGLEAVHVDSFVNVLDPFLSEDVLSNLAETETVDTIFFSPETVSWRTPSGRVKNESTHPLALLTSLLFRRYCLEKHGFTVYTDSPDDNNGEVLKNEVLEFAASRGLEMDFVNWLNMETRFINTFVQFSCGEGTSMGDGLHVLSEQNILFRLDRPDGFLSKLSKEEDFDLRPYYQLRKHLLGGAMSACCAYAMLHGVETVAEFAARQKLAKHLTVSVFEEIIPALDVNFETTQVYAMDMIARLEDPHFTVPWTEYRRGLAKRFVESLVPVIREYLRRFEKVPRHLTFALACTLCLFRSETSDEPLEKEMTELDTPALLRAQDLWGCDLSELTDAVLAFEAQLEG